MKTHEDEAFDELSRRQGDWGGGFKAKQAMAADKLLEEATRSCNNIDEQRALDALMREAQPAQEPRDIAKLVEGMEVSVDVSTGEHDSGNRLFGTVTLAQENQGSKHGLILLVQDPEPNFNPAPLPVQPEPVAKPYAYEYGRCNGDGTFSVVIEKGDLVQTVPAVYNYVRPRNAHKDWPIKELFDAPPQREWADLTYEDWKKIENMPDTFYQGVAWAQAKLKEKNT